MGNEEYESILAVVEKAILTGSLQGKVKALEGAKLEIISLRKKIMEIEKLIEAAKTGEFKPLLRKYYNEVYELE